MRLLERRCVADRRGVEDRDVGPEPRPQHAAIVQTDPLRGLGVDRYPFTARGPREELVPERVALQRSMKQAELAKAHPVAARLNPREAIYTHPLALHPGATRYFRQIKP